MKSRLKLSFRHSFICLIAGFAAIPDVDATTIRYTTVLGNVSGTLSGKAFSGETLTMTMTADPATTGRWGPPAPNPAMGFYNDVPVGNAMLTLSGTGGGTFTVTDLMGLYADTTGGYLRYFQGSAYPTADHVELFIYSWSPAYESAESLLTTGGSGTGGSWTSSSTVNWSNRALNLSGANTLVVGSGTPISMTSTLGDVSAVPEPASLLSMAGLLGGGLLLRRRAKARL